MSAVVAIPQVVEELLVQFADFFPNEPSRRHFAEYMTGLLIAGHKTVSGIARECADTTDQSCLNRWLTKAPSDAECINAHRLEWLQGDPTTKYRQGGVIAIDTTLIDHDGKLIDDAGWFWDHADQRHLIAHDYLFANYVHSSGKHYPYHWSFGASTSASSVPTPRPSRPNLNIAAMERNSSEMPHCNAIIPLSTCCFMLLSDIR